VLVFSLLGFVFRSFDIECSAIAIYKPPDVRPILQAYHGKDIAYEYAKKEAEAKQRHVEEWQNSRKGIASGGFTLSRLFGSNISDSVSLLLTIGNGTFC
jgi:hypothetical protein